jgi:hypothetical protein
MFFSSSFSNLVYFYILYIIELLYFIFIMSRRKYTSGYEKLKKKKRIDSLIQSKKGALDKY